MAQTESRLLALETEPAETPFTRRTDGRVLRFVRDRGAVHDGERVLVAVSGGPDSTALLLILARLRDRLPMELAVAHFDHMLRSRREAAGDETFVRALAGSLALPAVCGRGSVAARVRRAGESVEEAARHLRYAFLAREARHLGCTVVALGHTRDDQAESVLLHLLRGSGLDGLAGMRPRSSWPLGRGPDAARPLLGLTRANSERYCREAGVEPRQDPTNELLIATRNRVRLELMPRLREFNPRVGEALARLADAVAADADYLDRAAGAAFRRLVRRKEGGLVFPQRELAALPQALAARLLLRASGRLAAGTGDLEAVHVRAILEALGKRRARVSLPHGITVVVDAQTLLIVREEAPPAAPIPDTPLAVPGRTNVPGWTIEADEIPPPAAPARVGPYEAYLDADAVGDRLTVRSRRPGDRLRPLGLGGEKKVQDLLVDAKVPQRERDRVPIVCASWGIAWVVGHRIAERAALGPSSRRAVRLRVEAVESS